MFGSLVPHTLTPTLSRRERERSCAPGPTLSRGEREARTARGGGSARAKAAGDGAAAANPADETSARFASRSDARRGAAVVPAARPDAGRAQVSPAISDRSLRGRFHLLERTLVIEIDGGQHDAGAEGGRGPRKVASGRKASRCCASGTTRFEGSGWGAGGDRRGIRPSP